MKNPTMERIISGWFRGGLEDLFFAFQIESSHCQLPDKYVPFLCSMGFEKICKAYLLALNSAKYETLNWNDAKEMVDCLAKKWGHSLKKMVKMIRKQVNDPDVDSILCNSGAGFNEGHKTTLEALEAAYLECRYPVPHYYHEKFPVFSLLAEGHPTVYDDPIGSINFVGFCASFAGKISRQLKENFGVLISKNDFNRIVTGEAGIRFCNLYLTHFELNDE